MDTSFAIENRDRLGNDSSASWIWASPEWKELELIGAARIGDQNMVKLLLEKVSNEIAPEAKSSALLIAAGKGYAGIVRLLLEKAGHEILLEDKEYAIKEILSKQKKVKAIRKK